MRRIASISFCLTAILLLAVSCKKEEIPSYVGTWLYSCSNPDLGPEYKDSYVRVEKNWDYEFYDGGTGMKFSGDGLDFSADGLTITLNAHNDDVSVVFVATVTYLKGGKMKVVTDSVNGMMTEIEFKEQRSF